MDPSPAIKRIVCLANSRKLHGRCIAGRVSTGTTPGGWVRPVSSREHEEVSEYERQYEDGSDPRVLDVLDVPLLRPLPRAYQQENWLLDPKGQWRRVGRTRWSDIWALLDPVATRWIDGHSSYNGRNDRIPLAHAQALRSSLRLVHVADLQLGVLAPGEAFGNSKRRVQAKFHHAGTEYRLWVTDPGVERAFLPKPDGDYHIGECILTVSLGEAHNDFTYKLVAAIIGREEASAP